MEITELYCKGKADLIDRKIGFTLGAVETGWVMKNNRNVLDSYYIRQRAIDAPAVASTDIALLDVSLSTPVIMSAMTMPIPAIRDGALMMAARGLKEAGSMMWTGTPIPDNLKELAGTGVPIIQNLKPFSDRDKLYKDLDRIQEAGVTWIGVEIDAGQGTKIGDQLVAKNCAPLSMKELEEIRRRTKKPLVFKGILSRHDAVRSVEAGADVIMVSNHGAHTLDYLPHPFQVMDEIMEAVKGKVHIMVDGGFRRGSDVMKGLALGADLVGLGRPVLYGLAADGQSGVRDLMLQITDELRRLMIMAGASRLQELNRDCIAKAG